jgi:hypothetical protein
MTLLQQDASVVLVWCLCVVGGMVRIARATGEGASESCMLTYADVC